MDDNFLSGGVDILNQVKEQLNELQNANYKEQELIQQGLKAEKSIRIIEKESDEEQAAVLKRRRQEIEGTFDDQLNKLRSRIKKLRDKRGRKKNQKMSERMEEETASFREENKRLKSEGKALLKQNQIPSYCNSKLYYSLYFPKHLEEFMLILLALLFTLVIIPGGVYFFLLPDKILYLILTYIITVLIFGGLYLAVGNRTKDDHGEILREVRVLRSGMRTNNKKIKVIKRGIRRDADESTYGLEGFDQELNQLLQEETQLEGQKQEAMSVFENTTAWVIAAEVKKPYIERMEVLMEEYGRIKQEERSVQDKIKALTLTIAQEYEPYMGKDFMVIEQLDTLIHIINSGNAATISEAMAYVRQNTH